MSQKSSESGVSSRDAAPPFLAQRGVEAATVGDPGERVEGREPLQQPVLLFELPADLGERLVVALHLGRVGLQREVVGGERLEVVAHAVGEDAQQGHQGRGVRHQVRAEDRLRDLEHEGVVARAHRRGALARLDQGHLADAVSRPLDRDLACP